MDCVEFRWFYYFKIIFSNYTWYNKMNWKWNVANSILLTIKALIFERPFKFFILKWAWLLPIVLVLNCTFIFVLVSGRSDGQRCWVSMPLHHCTETRGFSHHRKVRKEGNVLFNNTLNTFYLRLYGIRHMVKDHSDSERGNPLPPHGLLFPISSKGSFICIIPQTGWHIPQHLLHQLWSTSWNEK